ncbi:MAG: hypothetical protein Q7R88_02180 [bacterium]|nr:hypothetical protein [bacterium]
MEGNLRYIITFVPETHAVAVRLAMGNVGAGKIGNYTHCSFSVKGTGRFIPQTGAHPALGKVGEIEEVPEERIEMVCRAELLNEVITAIKKAHPYEEVPIFIFPLENVE